MRSFPTTTRAVQRLLIFARLPQRGRVKTRLAAEFGADRALELYRAMLADLLERIGHSDPEIDVDVVWTAVGEVGGDELRDAFGDRQLTMQTGKDLGERLVVAFSERVVFHPTEKIVAIGVDDPRLGRDDVRRSFRLLDSCDWVIGPALDGGYYLIGCRAGSFHTSVFDKIEWGTPRVFRETEQSIRALGATVAVLPERRDLDVPSDLRSWAAEDSDAGTRLRRLIEQWGLS